MSGYTHTPESVALELFHKVVSAERADNPVPPEKKYILDTYAECLLAVRNPGGHLSHD